MPQNTTHSRSPSPYSARRVSRSPAPAVTPAHVVSSNVPNTHSQYFPGKLWVRLLFLTCLQGEMAPKPTESMICEAVLVKLLVVRHLRSCGLRSRTQMSSEWYTRAHPRSERLRSPLRQGPVCLGARSALTRTPCASA